jgi:iron only hydrogenase large subunit-like protein
MQENHIHDIDREQEAHEYNNAQPFDLTVTKDSIIPNVQTGIETLLNGIKDGNINALDVFATFKKLEKIFTEAKVKVEKHAFDEAEKYDKTFVFSGVSFTRKEGSESLNYIEDELCKSLSEKLKERQELVKLASKSKDVIFDSDGVQVPKVSSKFGKSSLSIKF